MGRVWGTKKIFYVAFQWYIDGDEIFLRRTEGNVPVHKARDIKRPSQFLLWPALIYFILIFLLSGGSED